MLGQTTGNSDSQDSPQFKLEWSHHLPPYSILCASPQGPHLNDILSWNFQMGFLKFPQLGLLRLWGPITLHVDIGLRWGLNHGKFITHHFAPSLLQVMDNSFKKPWSLVWKVEIKKTSRKKFFFRYSPCWELSNDMSHTTYTQGNRDDSWFLVVKNQTTNLTPDPSFGHNSCFKCLSGSCEPISDIYVSIAF